MTEPDAPMEASPPAQRDDASAARDMPLPAWADSDAPVPPENVTSRPAVRSASGSEDYRMLLTVIAGISLGVAATAMPVLIRGPYLTWTYAATMLMWLTGVAAVVLEYLAVLFGSRLYFRRVDVVATTSLALVFLAQAGMFVVISMGAEQLAPRWLALYAAFLLLAAFEAEHGRRVIVRHAGATFGTDLVRRFGTSLTHVVWLLTGAAMAALIFVGLWPDAPPPAVFAVSLAAFIVVVGANIQQRRSRDLLERHGALQD